MVLPCLNIERSLYVMLFDEDDETFFMGVCNVLLIISDKIHAKCFQITHKSMTLPRLKIT